MSTAVNSLLVAIALVNSVLAYDVHLSGVPFTPEVPPGTWKLTNNCGQASVAMVLAFYNHTTPTRQDISAIDDWLFQRFGDPLNNYNGSPTNTTKLTTLAREYGNFPGASHYSGWTITDLKKRLNVGHPVIVAVWTKMIIGTRRHFMVLIGMDDSFVYFNDPGLTSGSNKRYTISQFLTAWQNQQSAVVSIEPPTVDISTASCFYGPACTGSQGTTFNFEGTGFTPNAAVRRFVEGPAGGMQLSSLAADSNGRALWSFTSNCSTIVGTYNVFGVDDVTGTLSNKVSEIVISGNCPPPPTCTLTASPSTITAGGSSTLNWTTANNPTGAVITAVPPPDVGPVSPPTGGSTIVKPSSTTTYTLTVSNLGGSGMCSTVVTASSTGGTTFMKTVGTPSDDYASSIQQTFDGGFIVAGNTRGFGAGAQDVLLIKFDGAGAVQWATAAGGPGNDVAFSARQAFDGGYIVTGATDSFTGVSQILVAKFDGTGAFQQWASTVGNPSDSAAGLSVQQTTDSGYIVTGFPGGAIGGLGLLKYNGTGQLQWLRRALGINLYGNSVQQTSDGGYIVAGSKQIGTTYDVTLLKFDLSGNLQWAQLAGGSAYNAGNAVQQTSDGGYVVAGVTASFGAGGQDVLLLKYDGSGALQWARTAGGSGDDAADSVQQTSDGGYIVSGHTASFGAGGTVIFLLKFDSTGTLQWAKAGGGGSTSGTSVQQISGGGYVVAGSTASFGAGGSDVLLIKTDANGNIAGCVNWSSVSPSIGTTFPSAATSYGIDSPSFGVSARTLSVLFALPLTSNTQCTAP
jgi:uncharacterized protein YvpB